MKKELDLFLTALSFQTRIKVNNDIVNRDQLIHLATRYFPLVGLIVGGLAAFLFFGADKIFPLPVAVFLSFAFTIYITGAYNEEKFGVFCEGFGNGDSRDDILLKLKDNRISIFGVIGLIMIVIGKISILCEINSYKIPFIIVVANAASRMMPVFIIYTSKYTRFDITGKIKHSARKGRISDLIIAIVLGLGFLFILPWKFSVAAIPMLLLIALLFRGYIVKKIGGYTGSSLGAIQQIAEISIYLLFLLFQDNIL